MPRGGRNKIHCLTDVTVWQFADAAEPRARPAKPGPAATRATAVCRRWRGGAQLLEPEPESAESADDVNEEDESEEAAVAVGHRRSSRRRQRAAALAGGSATYPALLWQLLGGYIRPESVGAFAALCRDARRVTQTRAFWRALYLRWAWGPAAAADESAPHELRVGQVLGCQQLVRPRVIRALHRWHFQESPLPPPPVGLRFLSFAVRGHRLLVLFRRGQAQQQQPSGARRVPDTWEEEAADSSLGGVGDTWSNQRCPTEGQWLLTADLETCPPPACLEELLALDGRYALAGLRCAARCCGVVKSGGALLCEMTLRAPHGDSRLVAFACACGGGGGPRVLPWWRPGFLPELRGAD